MVQSDVLSSFSIYNTDVLSMCLQHVYNTCSFTTKQNKTIITSSISNSSVQMGFALLNSVAIIKLNDVNEIWLYPMLFQGQFA